MADPSNPLKYHDPETRGVRGGSHGGFAPQVAYYPQPYAQPAGVQLVMANPYGQPQMAYAVPQGMPVQMGGMPMMGMQPQQFQLPPGYQSHEQYKREWDAAQDVQKVWRGRQARRQVSAEMKYQYKGSTAYKPNDKAGAIVIQLHGARNIHDTQCCTKQDPYVVFTAGSRDVASEVSKSGGVKPQWPGKKVYYVSVNGGIPKKKRREVDRLKITIWNKNLLSDEEIGTGKVMMSAIHESAKKGKMFKEWIKIFTNNRQAGELNATIGYYPPVAFTIKQIQKLKDVQTVGKQDPYVRFTYLNKKTIETDKGVHETAVCRDGHRNPKWNEVFTFNVNDERHFDEKQCMEMEDASLRVEVINENHLVNDDIAYTEIPFSELYKARQEARGKKGAQIRPFTLYAGSHLKKGNKPAGDLFLVLH